MSTVGRLIVVVVVVAVLGVIAHDGLDVTKAHNDARNVAQSAASAAASAIAKAPAGSTPASKDLAGNTAAKQTAAAHGDVVTAYNFDPVADKVVLTIGATASTWVLGHIDRSMTDNITASSSASPPTEQAPK